MDYSFDSYGPGGFVPFKTTAITRHSNWTGFLLFTSQLGYIKVPEAFAISRPLLDSHDENVGDWS